MEWETQVTTGPLDLDLETTLELFITHWNTTLKLIHQHSNFPRGRAHKAEDMTLLVQAQVASALAAHSSVTDSLNDVIMAKQMNFTRRLDELQSSTDVPSTIGTSTSSALSALERSQNQVSELQRQLVLTRVTSPPPPPGSTPWCAPTTRTPPQASSPWNNRTPPQASSP